MTNDRVHPCLKRIDADCFRARPAWAKQAFAYRIVHLLTPKQLTKRLPRGLRRALLAPGVMLPPGVEMPPGVVVGPGGEIPAGWIPGDPMPPGAIAPGAAPPGVEATGAAPPTYTGVWSPGPVATAPPGGAVAVEPWFYDDFDVLDPAVWSDHSYGSGANSIDAEKLKMYSNASGDYAYLRTAADNTIPQAFTWTFELTVDSGTGEMIFVVNTGVYAFWVIFDPPTTLKFRRAGAPGYKDIVVDSFLATTDTWKFVFDGTLCDIYRNNVLVDSDLTIYEFTASKGMLILSCDNVLTVHIDDYTITPS